MSERITPPGASVTLRDIAEQTGLSVSAVSMALQDHPRIGAETKARVREVADDLGYVVNAAGRALRARRADAVALIVPNTSRHVFGHAYFMHVLTGVTDVANEHDAQLVISTNPDESHGMVAYERRHAIRLGRWRDRHERLGRRRQHRAARRQRPPDRAARPLPLPSGCRERRCGRRRRRANRHRAPDRGARPSVDRPHQRTAQPPERDRSSRRIPRGLCRPRRRAPRRRRRLQRGLRARRGRRDRRIRSRLRRHLRRQRRDGARRDDPPEVIPGTDVPTRVSIIGFDDFGISRVTSPTITTVHVPAERMARLATQRLFDIVNGARIEGEDAHAVLPVELVVRESCGCGTHP